MTTPQRPGDSRSSEGPATDPSPLSSPLDPRLASIEPSAPVGARLPVAPTKKPAGSGSSSRMANLLLGVAGVVAVAGIAFAAGRMTAPVAAAGDGRGFGGGGGNGEFPGGFGGGAGGNGGGFGGGLRGAGVLQGTVVAVAPDSLTLQIGGVNGNPGLEIKIPLAASTTVHTEVAASSSVLAAGQKVLVQLGAPTAGSTPAPAASGAPRQVQAPASNVTIITP